MNDHKIEQKNVNDVKIRIANYSDITQLAKVHYRCSQLQPGGFMHQMGLPFFKKYYKILIKEPTSVIICADAGDDGIVGLATGTMDASREIATLQAHRLALLWSTLPTLIQKPGLIKAVYHRNKLLAGSSTNTEYLVNEGPRSSFWGYLPDHPSKGMAIRLLKTLLNIMEDLGAGYVKFEIDQTNTTVQKICKMLGAEIVKEFVMFDGRIRSVWVHRLQPDRRRQLVLKK